MEQSGVGGVASSSPPLLVAGAHSFVGESGILVGLGDLDGKSPGHLSLIGNWSFSIVPGAFGNEPCN